MKKPGTWIFLITVMSSLLLYVWSLFPSFQSVLIWFEELPLLIRQLIIASGVVLGIGVLVLVALILQQLRKLRTESNAYKSLLDRNFGTSFHSIQAKYQVRRQFDSKAKLDRTTIQSVFEEELLSQWSMYENVANQLQSNQQQWQEYTTFYNELLHQVSTSNKPWHKKRLERFILQQKRLIQPVLDIEFFILMTYTSPKGRNHYEKRHRYFTREFILQLERSKQYLERVSTQEYLRAKERSKMTTSMRFKILKRDNYRCQICGASQRDGAKLHIDHIIPVAKGGTTVASNLHVLCDRCNLGKGTRGL
jgi:5-methylcytosine-specific restriction endonuclease McrA